MANPNLKDAVLQVLEDEAKRAKTSSIHSDLIIRKFPQVNEQELINAIGELIVDGAVTAKASSVDAYGTPKAFHIHVRGVDERPGAPSQPPRSGVGEFNVGFGGTTTASSRRATEEPEKPRKVGLKIKDDKIDVGFSVDEPPKQPAKTEPSAPKPERLSVSMGGKKEAPSDMQDKAEQAFEEELTSFFSELQVAAVADEDAKKELTDQLMLLMAMFKTGEVEAFATPINKLAVFKSRVKRVVPDLVNDYILLVQAAVRAWLAKV
jgi:hypothetical protein